MPTYVFLFYFSFSYLIDLGFEMVRVLGFLEECSM
jgi:hypothetical protein